MTLLHATLKALSTYFNRPLHASAELGADEGAQHVLDLFKAGAPSWEIIANILTMEKQACQLMVDEARPYKAQLLGYVTERNDPAITQSVIGKLCLTGDALQAYADQAGHAAPDALQSYVGMNHLVY